jgi:hypothetical protein
VTIGARPCLRAAGGGGFDHFVFDERERQLQVRTYERAIGSSHTLRAGGDVVAARFRLFAAGTNPLGAYVVVNNGDISPPASRSVGLYRHPGRRAGVELHRGRPAATGEPQAVYGAFIEDSGRSRQT